MQGKELRVMQGQEHAKRWYEFTRGAKAFNIPKQSESLLGYIRVRANGAARWYEFRDSSRLVIYRDGTKGGSRIAWGYARGFLLAIRYLWER